MTKKRDEVSKPPRIQWLRRNPHFSDFLQPSRPPERVDEPFSGAISAGKNTYVYDAHTYHTNVPPQGIAKLIEYYTDSGGDVLDPFYGSGMTGVAAGEHGRKALLSDLSPAAVFIAKNLNEPVDAGAYMKAVRTLLDQAAELEHTLYDTYCRICGEPVPMIYMV